MAETGSPVIGFKDLVYAVMLSGDTSASVAPVYDTVAPLCKTAKFGYDPAATQVVAYFDDQSAYSFYNEGEKSITLETDHLTTAVKAIIYGQTVVNGVIQSGSADNPPYIAIGGKFTRGDGSSDYFWIPKVQLAKGPVNADTKGATIAPQNDMLTGKILNLTYNGNWMTMVNTAHATVPAATITNWFANPVIAATTDLNALTVTAAAGTTGKIVFTFAKTGGGNVYLNDLTITNSNFIIAIDSTGAIATPTSWTIGASGGATQLVTANGLTAVKHDFTVNGVADNYGVKNTIKAGSVTVV